MSPSPMAAMRRISAPRASISKLQLSREASRLTVETGPRPNGDDWTPVSYTHLTLPTTERV